MRSLLLTLAMLLGAISSPAQSAQLNWTWNAPGGSDPIVSYNLYQSDPCSSTYVKLASNITATSFIQTPVPAGTSCTYVTAVDADGLESVPSNTFQFSFAGYPAPPTGLTATLSTAAASQAAVPKSKVVLTLPVHPRK